jgi:RNA polymerase sigma factor (sigma-70 family)
MATSDLSEQMPDAELWRSVCQGSVPAFEVVVRRYQSLVSAVAYNCCGDLALSEDVAQEAFWSAWRARASLAEPSRLAAWLCGIARNIGHNARRQAARAAHAAPLEAAASVPTGGPGPVETAVSREEEALVWQALAQIPESYREPLILFYRQEQSVAQVAAALDLSPDAVKQRLSRGRGLLQERVAQLVERALRRSRPGRPFTVAVVAGLATLSVGAKTALASEGAVQAAGPLAKAAGAGVTSGLIGSVLGSLGGFLGAWLGVWVPSQLAPTKPEREYLWQRGKRILLVTVLFAGLLALGVWSFAGQISVATYLILLGVWFAGLWSYIALEIIFMARALKRIRVDAASPEPNDAPLRVGLDALTSRYRGRVFRSRTSLFGLPLLDVNVGDPVQAGRPAQRRVARGWIAVGDEAYGVLFALGGRAFGLIAFGGIAVGLVAVGGVALGALALGGVAAGGVAIGGLGLGWQACGGAAVGWEFACGGGGVAWHAAQRDAAVAQEYAVGGAAWAEHANDDAAKSVISDQPLLVALHWLEANASWLTPLIVPVFLLACGAALLLMYRRQPRC